MNAQKPGIEWTRVWNRPGFTWNPVSGCFHDCKWDMPDGQTAVCYADTVASRVAQAAYPQGFAHYYWNPARLDEPIKQKEPSGIFIDSMSDLFGRWVPETDIQQVLDVCAKASQHIYFVLTKNAPRLLKFDFPANVWVGASMPPDYFMGQHLTRDQQTRMLRRSLEVLAELKQTGKASTVWMSFEPLSWDVAPLLQDCPLDWAVIGAASQGKTYYQPEPAHITGILDTLARFNVPVFFKGNLRPSPAADPWRQEFPPQPTHDTARHPAGF